MESQMTTNVEKLEKAQTKENDLRADYKKLGKKLDRAIRAREKLEKLVNEESGSFTDIEWLISNPLSSGQHEALQEYMKRYGEKEWTRGVRPAGYYANKDYTETQQGFSFDLDKPDRVETVERFLMDTIPYFKALSGDTVRFSYGTGQYSGIHQIGYKPEDKTWWTFRTQYSSDKDWMQHYSMAAALTYAAELSKRIEDD